MKKVVFLGAEEKILPTLGVSVKPGDEIEVPEDFVNGEFAPVAEEEKKVVKGDK